MNKNLVRGTYNHIFCKLSLKFNYMDLDKMVNYNEIKSIIGIP